MASFYGNIKNNSRSSFIFDRIYSSRSQMEDALNNNIDPETQQVIGDGVFINRYVLINYSYSVDGAYQQVPKASVNENNYTNYYVISQKDPSKKVPASLNENTNGIKPWSDAQNIDVFYQKSHYVDRFDLNFNENEYYRSNRELDAGKYFASYDHTVWQKIYSDNKEKYILVAELNAEAPTFELIPDAPAAMNGVPHFDLSLSSELNYVYHVPKNWDIILNTYKPGETTANDDKHYWYYESDLLDEDKTFDIKEEYPFINKKGFDKTTRVMKPVKEEGFNLIETKSDMVYPQHQYRPIQLTVDTYVPNRYFILDEEKLQDFDQKNKFDINKYYFVAEKNNETYKLYKTCILKLTDDESDKKKYLPIEQTRANEESEQYYVSDSNPFSLAKGSFQENATIPTMYYELTTIPIGEGERLLEHDKDTKRLDIYLPSIGNAIATMYDAIYGRPRYQSRKIIGYTSAGQIPEYTQDDFGGYEIQLSQYSLTNGQVNALKIPIYLRNNKKFCGYLSYGDLNKYEQNADGTYLIFGTPYNLKEGIDAPALYIPGKNDPSYDIPVYELVNNIIGYTTAEDLSSYYGKGQKNDNGPYLIEGGRYDLTDDDIKNLSPEMIPGSYDIPVYANENMNARPYDDDKLFGTFAPPYDNIGDEDSVSMGWALDALKKYISELRYLANGQNNATGVGNGIGLQSDWTLDDDQSFGYIYHKPDIITSFINSTDETPIVGKTYYEKKIDNDEASPNYGTNYFEEVPSSSVSTNPKSSNYYELPKTLIKNAETDFYKEESIVGYVSSADINSFEKRFAETIIDSNTGENNIQYVYFQTATTYDPSLTYYKKENDDFSLLTITSEEDFNNASSENGVLYTKIIETNLDNIFKINNTYYFISQDNQAKIQSYADLNKSQEVIDLTIDFDEEKSYFVRSGSRYVPAYKTIGSYTLQPITSTQRAERCLCYFNKFQEIKVEGGVITERRYTFNSYGDINANIYLTTNGNLQDTKITNISNEDISNKRISQFNIVIKKSETSTEQETSEQQNDTEQGISEQPGAPELEITSDDNNFYIKSIENMTREQLVKYLFPSEEEGETGDETVTLPQATVEIVSVFPESFSIYINRNSNAFDFNQYVTNIQQVSLDRDYWESSRANTTYYIRDFKPIIQLDYEINTIWNSVQVDD